MKLWTGCAVLAMIAGLAWVGCGKKEGPGSVSVDQSSAKATMETVAKAFKAHDGKAMAECLPPDMKDSMGPIMEAGMEVAAKADSLKKTIEAKFGKDVAEKALKGTAAGGQDKGPLSEGLNDDGSVNWDKAKVTENGDTATVEINGKPSKEGLKKINGKWYMDMKDMTPEKAKAEGAKAAKMAKVMGDAFESVEKQVKDGTVGKDDINKALGEAMMKVMTEAMKEAAPPK